MMLRPYRALVVDDDQAAREFVADSLLPDFESLPCSAGTEALERISEGEYDVALVDYRLPDMDGLDVVRALQRKRRSTPVIFMTGYGDYTVACCALRIGATILLEKPFEQQTVHNAALKCVSMTPACTSVVHENPRLKRVLEYIDEHIYRDLSMKCLLSETGFSRTAFFHFFKRNAGKTYREYVCDVRLCRAKYLLSSGDLTLTDIAEAIGFLDSSYLCHWFRTRTGLTPMQYRRRHSGGPSGNSGTLTGRMVGESLL